MKIRYSLMTIVFLLIFLELCFAQWSTDPAENNIVSRYLQNPIIASDMQNGILVAGQTHPQHAVIYVQRMSVDGARLWPGEMGVKICDSPLEQWLTPAGATPDIEYFLSDGERGCYIGYQIAKFIGMYGESDYHDQFAYIQRLDSNGNRLFGPNGLELMPEEEDSTGHKQRITYWCLDGQGGIYVSFYRIEGTFGDNYQKNGCYLARISGNGEFIWGPKNIANYSHHLIPYLDKDLNLNIYYYPNETVPPVSIDKFIKINANTGEIISEKEIEIGAGDYGFNIFFDFSFSDNYSAIFAFQDFRTDTLRVQKLDEDGNKLWGDEPIIVTSKIKRNNFDVESDQKGGSYIYYNTDNDTFRITHFDRQGNRSWDKSFYSTHWINRHDEKISVDSNGDAFLLTERYKYLTKIANTGEVLWITTVTTRDTLASSWSHGLKADSLGGCIVLWHEIGKFVSDFVGFRAQRVDVYGYLGGPTLVPNLKKVKLPEILKLKTAYPNPFNNSILIYLLAPHCCNIDFKIYNILGKEVYSLKSKNLAVGENIITWNGKDINGQDVASGLYFYQLKTNESVQTKKLTLIR
ncbi:MAG: T9SS type A sorting domain-containing protein [Candidatus Zhuqueibacterota bacterium]